jgi:hypothetical protein
MCGMSVPIWNRNEIVYTELEQSVLNNKKSVHDIKCLPELLNCRRRKLLLEVGSNLWKAEQFTRY